MLATVAGQLQSIYVMVTGRDLRPFGNSDPGYWAVYVLGAVLGGVLISAIMIRQAALASGTASSARTALMQGLKNAPAVWLMGLLMLVLIGIWFVPVVVIPAAYRSWSSRVAVGACHLSAGVVCVRVARAVARRQRTN